MIQKSCLVFLALLGMGSSCTLAQSITGYSVIEEGGACPPGTILPPPPGRPRPQIVFPPGQGPNYCTPQNWIFRSAHVYSNISEDYIAALYYNVENVTAEYYGDQVSPLSYIDSGSQPGSAFTSGDYTYPDSNQDGMYSEVTAHYLNFFYVSSAGEYYDPYGYSDYYNGNGFTNGSTDSSYGDGYWLQVNAYGLYIGEAAVLLGQTTGSLNHNTPTSKSGQTSARSYSTFLQVFIPADNVQAPYTPPPYCSAATYFGAPVGVFQGDNRMLNTAGGSYRAFQQVSLGLGGVYPPTSGTQDTGYSHLFAQDSFDGSGHISAAAKADVVTGDCHYLIHVGKAPTATMVTPRSSYSGTTAASTTFTGDAGDPLAPSPAVSWNGTINLTQTAPNTINVQGYLRHDCFPGYELSVANNDVEHFIPTDYSLTNIGLCLAGVNSVNDSVNKTINVGP